MKIIANDYTTTEIIRIISEWSELSQKASDMQRCVSEAFCVKKVKIFKQMFAKVLKIASNCSIIISLHTWKGDDEI